jgi:hypothetical protein
VVEFERCLALADQLLVFLSTRCSPEEAWHACTIAAISLRQDGAPLDPANVEQKQIM